MLSRCQKRSASNGRLSKRTLTIEHRSAKQFAWTVAVDGLSVSEGISPGVEHAQDAAVDAAVEMAGGR